MTTQTAAPERAAITTTTPAPVPMTVPELRLWAAGRADAQLGPGGDATPEQISAYWGAVATSVDNWGEWFTPAGYEVDLTPDWRTV